MPIPAVDVPFVEARKVARRPFVLTTSNLVVVGAVDTLLE